MLGIPKWNGIVSNSNVNEQTKGNKYMYNIRIRMSFMFSTKKKKGEKVNQSWTKLKGKLRWYAKCHHTRRPLKYFQSNLMFISFAEFFFFFLWGAWMHIFFSACTIEAKRKTLSCLQVEYFPFLFFRSSVVYALCLAIILHVVRMGKWRTNVNQRFLYIYFFILRLFVLLQIMNFVWNLFFFYRITL